MSAMSDLDLRIRRDYPNYMDAERPYCRCGSPASITNYIGGERFGTFTLVCDRCSLEFRALLSKSGYWRLL